MSTKKDLRIVGDQRGKLIVGLTMDDAVAAINLALRVRKAAFVADFTHKDHLARLYIEMPGVQRELIYLANPRTKTAQRFFPQEEQLNFLINDMHDRLAKLECGLLFAAEKPFNQKPECKLQLHVSGARRVVLTLMDCKKGATLRDTSFQLPDGTTP